MLSLVRPQMVATEWIWSDLDFLETVVCMDLLARPQGGKSIVVDSVHQGKLGGGT
jgi:hypothetical protein